MPNRIIKESICTSDNIDCLTAFEETCFYRLMVNCDDFGRFDARPKILSSRLFPLKNVTPDQMQDALNALVDADLVTVYEVDGKPYLHLNSWERHQQTRATKSKYPEPIESNFDESDNTCNQLISDDSKCPRNRIRNRNTIHDIRNRHRNSETFVDDDEAAKINDEQNRVLDAAEDAGFQRTNSVRAKLLDLFSVHGKDKMLAGIDSCVKHGATNLAYLEAVLKGEPKKLPAQNYEQRSYSGYEEEALDRIIGIVNDKKAQGG